MKLINADDVKEMLESYRYHSFNLDDALHVIDSADAVYTDTDTYLSGGWHQDSDYKSEYIRGFTDGIKHMINIMRGGHHG